MSWRGLEVARLFGLGLPAFADQATAAAHLFRQRDERLGCIIGLAATSSGFVADFTPASLKHLERWYFDLCEADGFGALGVSREEFECCMASYFCELAVRNCADAEWEVREFDFERGKFEIGIRRGRSHWMLSRFTDQYKLPNNKRKQKIFRMYLRFAA